MGKLVLCIAGMPGSGKTLAAKIIKKKFNAFIVSSGDIIREEIKRRGLKYTKENDEKISRWFHSGREDMLASRICEKLKKSKRRIVVSEGPRNPGEPNHIEECLGIKPIIIALAADFKTRYKRELKRKRFGKETKKYLLERDRRELSYGLGRLLMKADYKISNKGSIKNTEKKIIALVDKLKKRNE